MVTCSHYNVCGTTRHHTACAECKRCIINCIIVTVYVKKVNVNIICYFMIWHGYLLKNMLSEIIIFIYLYFYIENINIFYLYIFYFIKCVISHTPVALRHDWPLFFFSSFTLYVYSTSRSVGRKNLLRHSVSYFPINFQSISCIIDQSEELKL